MKLKHGSVAQQTSTLLNVLLLALSHDCKKYEMLSFLQISVSVKCTFTCYSVVRCLTICSGLESTILYVLSYTLLHHLLWKLKCHFLSIDVANSINDNQLQDISAM